MPKEKGRVNANQEVLCPTRQAHLSPRDAILSGVPKSVTTLLYYLATNRDHPEPGYPGHSLWLSLSAASMPGSRAALAECTSRCDGPARLYVRFGCGPRSRVNCAWREHRTVDEIHQPRLHRLAPFPQTISRRESLFLFEAYTALLRSGTEVTCDQEWRAVVQLNGGLLLSIDGIQPGHQATKRSLWCAICSRGACSQPNTSPRAPRTRVTGVLAPVVALELPILGVISDAQESHLQARAELWPGTPHQICQLHARKRSRASHLRLGSSHQDGYAHRHASRRRTNIVKIFLDAGNRRKESKPVNWRSSMRMPPPLRQP